MGPPYTRNLPIYWAQCGFGLCTAAGLLERLWFQQHSIKFLRRRSAIVREARNTFRLTAVGFSDLLISRWRVNSLSNSLIG